MKMKRLAVMTAAVAILTATAARADDWLSSHFCYDSSKPLFNNNEFSIDAFGAYETQVHQRSGPIVNNFNRNGIWGGGLGLTYFSKYLGIGGESAAFSGTHNFFDYAGGNLYARLPIESLHMAPYIFGTGGRYFNPESNWYYGGGAGLEFRLTQKFGIFGDARYEWRQINVFGDTGHFNIVEARVGARFIF